MTTITYLVDFINPTGGKSVTPTTSLDQGSPSLALLETGSFVQVSTSDAGDTFGDIEAIALSKLQPETQAAFTQPLVNSTTIFTQTNPDSVGLVGGGWVTAFDSTEPIPGDPSNTVNEVRFRIFGDDGQPLGFDSIATSGSTDSDFLGGVTAMADGGFAIALKKIAGASGDIYVRVFDGAGGLSDTTAAEISSKSNSFDPSAAGLTGGGLAVAWSETRSGGTEDLFIRQFDGSNMPLSEKILVDTAGSINSQATLLGLKDGGFALAYRDNGWAAADGQDITLRIYNADGTARSGFIRVNIGDTAGIQNEPALTQLENGFIAVSWTSNPTGGLIATDIMSRLFDANGAAITGSFAVANSAFSEMKADILGIGSGKIAYAWQTNDEAADGSLSAVLTGQTEIRRVSVANVNGEIMTGDELGDNMVGSSGADTIDGAGGNDIIRGDGGADNLTGGLGFDIVNYAVSMAGVSINLATAAVSGGDADGDILTADSFEAVIGSEFDDVLTGDGGYNDLNGGGGGDLLDGGAGDDYLFGGNGNDHFLHSGGADSFRDAPGEPGGIDWVDYSAAASGVVIGINDSVKEGGAAAGDEIFAFIEWISGSAFSDILVGSDAGDKLMGGAGADRIEGREGADVLEGGKGNNTLVYANSDAAVSINLATLSASGGDAEGDVIKDFSRVAGSEFNDKLTGSGGTNILTGGLGADKLAGGLGKDIFDYNAIAESTFEATGRDTISDFDENGADKIDLSTIDANDSLAGNNSFTFIGSAALTGLGQVRVTQGATNTTIWINTTEGTTADMRIVLSGLHVLDAADFVL